MDNRRLAGMITILIGLFGIIAYLNAGNGTPVESWPLEAYLSMAASIETLTSVSTTLVYVLTVGLLFLIITRLYKTGIWAYDQMARRG
ncbi:MULTISPECIES: hypothetical protein [Psychrobacter]|uniref:Uncharacterized protein n=1 Tax=Psychrobacter alimentarius TaxID=261164 RepID=A0ABN4N4Q4_9GAMM|nr:MULTISPECIES: hypothetical protein [Psychrobacter]AMT97983.1 hypothetical protein A3K91_2410 [Psychrobacter alimentarius]QCB29745.1 hypothetical protein E5677_01385 [Psychrobacter sp. PAMC27889]